MCERTCVCVLVCVFVYLCVCECLHLKCYDPLRRQYACRLLMVQDQHNILFSYLLTHLYCSLINFDSQSNLMKPCIKIEFHQVLTMKSVEYTSQANWTSQKKTNEYREQKVGYIRYTSKTWRQYLKFKKIHKDAIPTHYITFSLNNR